MRRRLWAIRASVACATTPVVPKVIVESSEGRAEVDAPEGGRLVDLCDERALPVPFNCRSASCGTCRIRVLEGADLLEEPADDELDVLEIFGDRPGEKRLACQAKLRAGQGILRIRPAED